MIPKPQSFNVKVLTTYFCHMRPQPKEPLNNENTPIIQLKIEERSKKKIYKEKAKTPPKRLLKSVKKGYK